MQVLIDSHDSSLKSQRKEKLRDTQSFAAAFDEVQAWKQGGPSGLGFSQQLDLIFLLVRTWKPHQCISRCRCPHPNR